MAPGAGRCGDRRGATVAISAAFFVVFGCAPAKPASTVSLRLSGPVDDAAVTIDDEYVGTLGYVRRRGVALPAGVHRVTVEASGFFPWDRLVEAKSEPVRLDVQLTPIPD